MTRHLFGSLILALGAFCGMLAAVPAGAADGEVLITQAKALAGNITPGDPAGFPAIITQSGSYKLASNLFPGPNLNGIVVNVPDVTIDLNGFELEGGPAGGVNNSKHGIVGYGDRLTVKNGTIGAFRISGIIAESMDYLVVENMRLVNNYYGINNENGDYARIQNNTIATNRFNGIRCGTACHIEGNVVSNNGNHGIYAGSGMVLGNSIFLNQGAGIAADGRIGFGNNTILDNGFSVYGGTFTALHPNVCAPGAC